MVFLFFLLFFSCSANDLDIDKDFNNCTSSKQKLDIALRKNFAKFKDNFKDKRLVLSDNPLVDYALFLSQYAKRNSDVAYALDYLIKTGASWGISSKKANSYQVSVLSTVAHITKDFKKNWQKDFDINSITNQDAIIKIQNSTISDKSQLLIDALTNEKCRFLSFEKKILDKKFLTEGDFAKHAIQSIYFGNDFYWFGFCSGIFKDSQDRLLQDILGFDNKTKESKHNYIQWLFPISTIGQGDNEPRTFTLHTYDVLKANPKLLRSTQEGLRKSFDSMFNFWSRFTEKQSDGSYKEKTPDDKLKNIWINGQDHNYLRINRILQCFRLFGLNDERKTFFDYLKAVKDFFVNNDYLQSSFNNFWSKEYSLHDLKY